VLHFFGDLSQWQEGRGVKYSAEMLDVVVVFVDCNETEFLNLSPSTLRHVVEATVYVDVAAEDCSDGIYHALFVVAVGSTL